MSSVASDRVPSTDDAAEYVESIMASQHAVKVNTPVTGRKRNRSAPSPSTMVKKARNADTCPLSKPSQNDASPQQTVTPRRELYRESITPATRHKVRRSRSRSRDEFSIELLMDRLSTDIGNRFSELIDRIDRLEQGLEQKIANKVAQILDKRINSELKRIRKDVDSHIENVTDSIKAEMAADIADINQRIDRVNTGTAADLSCNIVIRNLPEHHNEDINDKVISLIRDGCGVQDARVVSAERKRGPQGKPGVVIAKLRSADDKKNVMNGKRKLKHSRRYSEVYIQHDQSRTDRIIADNFRTMLSALKSGDHNLSVRGSRVIRNDNRSSDGARRHESQERESRQNRGRQNHNDRQHNNNRSSGYQSRRR